MKRSRIVAIGGTPRQGSSTERALSLALSMVEARGGRGRLFSGNFLAKLPHFNPGPDGPTDEQSELAQAIREADGVILGTPSYHGSVSGLLKNALDTLELTRTDENPYFHGKPVGIVITTDGGQASGTTLMAMRSIVHAMRGWPTPFGATLNSRDLFDEAGICRDPKDTWQLGTVAEQVMAFANLRTVA